MLKMFGGRKPKVAPKWSPSPPVEEERSSGSLRIIHSGGVVEHYYMAIPAATIIQKYPSFVLARPDVFRRPWDAIVAPQEILTPGHKYFVVPAPTVSKLIRRIKRPTGISNSALFLTSSHSLDTFSVKSSGIMIKSNNTTKSGGRRVRFFGIDIKRDSNSVSSQHSTISARSVEKSPNGRLDGRKRRGRSIVQWHSSLTSINENINGVAD